ncbi:aminotransferase class III-fold pyridoxal phosphate-dependent enzyme [Heyndrickxia sp. FSL W8-0423]|uniref:aminotransferase class III-fold pyridoxal phosphate-dependent enzyme n=1 Tax=Heyndrickxia sp. FSL W8-0423 TaxID=2921601 RepID=UPI0030FB09B2
MSTKELINNIDSFVSTDVWSPLDPYKDEKIIFQKGDGAYIWDINGKRYVDFINGKGSILLGHNDSDINQLLIESISNKSSTVTGPHQYIVALSEIILRDLKRDHYKIAYFSTGTEAVKASVNMVRMASKKSIILSSGYHGWDPLWYHDNGPHELNKNDILDVFFVPDLLKRAITNNKGNIAAFVISPDYVYLSEKTYNELFSICREHEIYIICDDVKQGYRYRSGNSLEMVGERADLYVFAKGLSNGNRLSCVVGPEQVMEFSRDFTYTSYYELLPYISALGTLKKMRNQNGYMQIRNIGATFLNNLREILKNSPIDMNVNGNGNLFQFVFPNDEIEEKFYRLCLLNGLLFFNGDNQCPNLAITNEVYDFVLKVITQVIEQLSSNYNTGSFSINDERRFISAWRQMDGASDFIDTSDRLIIINKLFSE